jgi:hypothetical protein
MAAWISGCADLILAYPCSHPIKWIRGASLWASLDFQHPVRFEAGDEFRDESAVSVGVRLDHEDRLSRYGVTTTLEHRALVVERDRFRRLLNTFIGFLFLGY